MSLIEYPVRIVSVDEERSGQRIDNFLISQFRGVPRSCVYRILRKGEVRVNKKRVHPDYKLQTGDLVRIPPVKVEDKPVIAPSANLTLVTDLCSRIVYETPEMLIINKPAGIAVHGGSGIDYGVIEALRSGRPELRFLELVHRLDRDTSGCLMIAKKRSALRNLHEQLRLKTVQKNYWALVRGKWSAKVKAIDQPLLKNILKSGERMVSVSREGKPSRTLYSILREYDCCTLVEASPQTGRTHQIRVHSTFASHPIALDEKYGDREFDAVMRSRGLNRMFLHARRITFVDPSSGKVVSVEAELDDNLASVLDALEKFSSTSR